MHANAEVSANVSADADAELVCDANADAEPISTSARAGAVHEEMLC